MRRNRYETEGPGGLARKILVALCIVCAVALGLLTAYALWERPPAQVLSDGSAKTGPGKGVVDMDSLDSPAQPEEGSARTTEDGAQEISVNGRKEGVYTILLVGRDKMSNSTDTIIVSRFDTVAHTVDCVSIPRDTLVNIGWANTPKKINAVYPGYINSGKDGVEGLKSALKDLMGFEPDCYGVVSMAAVEQAVDAIGGVWFDVPIDMNYDAPDQGLYIHISKGYQLLNGEDALKVCRFRDGYAGGDIQRIGVQQSFLKALAGQILDVGNIPNLGTFVDILTENVDTDLTASNIAWFIRQFLACSMEDVTFQTMPWSVGCTINGISFVSVDPEAWLAMINEKLNPFTSDITSAELNLLMSDSSGTVMTAGSGTVAGGADSFYCPGCSAKNGGKAVHHIPGVHIY